MQFYRQRLDVMNLIETSGLYFANEWSCVFAVRVVVSSVCVETEDAWPQILAGP